MNQLFYGDNLQVLKDHIRDDSVDLIYLRGGGGEKRGMADGRADPPFNSKRDYNLLFKSPKSVAAVYDRRKPSGKGDATEKDCDAHRAPLQGDYSSAQITAFEDSWHWGEQAEREFDELVHAPNTDVSEMMQALRRFLGENDMMAYLTMMANRLLQLHRVLKPTGSLYLHCDPTASHYLKIVLDGVFGKLNFQNEIVWKRTNAHNFKTKGYVRAQDVIFFYTKSSEFTFNDIYTEYGEAQMKRFKPDENGRLYKAENMTFSTPNKTRQFEWRGTKPPENRSWGASLEQLEKWWAEGRILKKQDGSPRMDGLKIYLDETKGIPLSTCWTDIDRVGNTSDERLGYPTQKPLVLLERIISASSNEGDVVLDPFCGCGTAVHAAQKLNRQWIGIDITHLAISLIEKRLKDAFKTGLAFEIHGTPKDLDAARDLATRDKYQFQWWAVSLVEAQPFQGKKKGADGGIDGLKFFHDVDKAGARKIVVSVKGGENVGLSMVKDLITTVTHNQAEIGLFITLAEPTQPMIAEAAKAGFYTSASGKKFPRLQILTIKGLLSGMQRAEHPDHQPDMKFKKAKAEAGAKQAELL